MIVPKPNYKRRTPKRGERGRVTKEQYQLAIDWFGDSCNQCNARPIEMHHSRFRAQAGRGGFRNLVPLCKKHHQMVHNNREFADHWRTEREEAFGEHFYKDAFDLHEEGLIDEPTLQLFENYMNEMGKNR